MTSFRTLTLRQRTVFASAFNSRSIPFLGIAFALTMTVLGCAPNTQPSITQTGPGVIATAQVSEIVGNLDLKDGCFSIADEAAAVYSLAWPADASVTISGDNITVVTGLKTGNQQQVDLKVGDRVRLSGGETDHLSPELQESIDPSCPGPFWVLGFEVEKLEP